jgi:hypothetical protein
MDGSFTADDEEVKALLAGVYKSRTIYFRIAPDGSHIRAKLTEELRALGASYYEVTQIFQTYAFNERSYESNRMKRIAAGLGKPKGKAARVVSGSRLTQEDEDENEDDIAEDDEVATEATTNKANKRYSLVRQNNGYYGAYDEREASLVLFRTQGEAESFISSQLNGKNLKPFYGSKI